MSQNIFEGNSLVIITGASKGFGRALAVAIPSFVQSECTLVLIARNVAGLEETKSMISNQNAAVHCVVSDLSQPREMETVIDRCMEFVDTSCINNYMIVHNAGSLGNVTLSTTMYSNYDEINEYMSFNVTSPMILTSRFVKKVEKNKNALITIVNLTSLCGIEPWPSLGMYGAAKSARTFYFQVLAKEHPEIRVLNWAPGALDTDMLRKGRDTSFSQEVRSTYQSLYANNAVLSCQQSAEKFCQVLRKNSFKSGAHVDYYDA